MIDSISEQAGAGADLKSARRERAARPAPSTDRLPPNSPEAERGVLGCILLEATCARPVMEKVQQDEVFYDLRHQTIWNAITYLVSENKPVDIIVLQAELKNRGLLDQIGGIPYLNELQDTVPSAANLPMYLDIVWEKYVFRRLVQKNTAQVATVYEFNGADEAFIANIEARHAEWRALLNRGAVVPKNLKPPSEFLEEYFKEWFDRREDTFGFALPFEIKLRFRPSETTLMTGDNGSGKSTMLCWLAATVARQLDVDAGERVVIASMEMPCAKTLHKMARQLLGFGPKDLEHTPENEALVGAALAWLNKRVLLYDFLGITNKNELVQAFEYGAEHQGGKFFILDNMMKVGIADDDYAAQGLFIQRVCEFSMRRKAHTIVVVHENKGEGNAKQKVRGSKQLTDAPDNVVGMQRNEKKAIKVEELEAEKKAGKLTEAAHAEALNELRFLWDSKFTLNKQRNGEQQNASKWLYFEKKSHRFNVHVNDPVISLIPLPRTISR
jgi:KaiC/GvpD/RAD55 family RecA-like ATPase